MAKPVNQQPFPWWVWLVVILFPIPFLVVHWWVTLVFFAIFAVLMWAIADYYKN